jgi:hypothetical protein
VYAIGDVVGAAHTHVANAHGRRLVRFLTLPLPLLPEGDHPSVAFVEPEVGQIGPTLAQLRRRWPDALLAVHKVMLSDTDRGRTSGLDDGFVQLVAMRLSGRLLAATVVAPDASEMLPLLSWAQRRRVSLWQLARLEVAYPALSDAIKQAADAFVFASLPRLPDRARHVPALALAARPERLSAFGTRSVRARRPRRTRRPTARALVARAGTLASHATTLPIATPPARAARPHQRGASHADGADRAGALPRVDGARRRRRAARRGRGARAGRAGVARAGAGVAALGGERSRLSVTVLAADGTLWYLDGSPLSQGAVRLARALAGEQATACGPALLVVDERGALRRLPRAPDLPVVSAIGPNVSRFHKPACDPDGGVLALAPNGSLLSLTRELEPRALAPVAALPDAELVVLDLGGGVSAVAVLTEPTQRYRHGALGDEVEAAAVTLLRLPDLEPLGHLGPRAAGGDRGAAPDAVAQRRRGGPVRHRVRRQVRRAAGAPGLGRGRPARGGERRSVGRLAALAAPDRRHGRGGVRHARPAHGGPLVRYVLAAGGEPPPLDGALDASAWRRSATTFDLGLRSHVDGERLLDRAALVGRLEGGADLLLVPSADQRELVWLRCDDAACEGVSSVRLPSPLATNVTLAPSALAPEAAVLADRSGGVWWLPLPLPLAGEATPPSPGER